MHPLRAAAEPSVGSATQGEAAVAALRLRESSPSFGGPRSPPQAPRLQSPDCRDRPHQERDGRSILAREAAAPAARLAYPGGVSSREELPRFVAPMLARTAPVRTGDGWAFEVKFDGMRLQLRRDGRSVCLRSRPGRDCTEEFPELALIQSALGRHRVLLDGELVCLGADGSPDFARLRRRLRAPADKARRHAERWPVTYLAFDLLHLDGRSTRQLPYERRRELLLELGLDGGVRWRTPRHFVGESERVLAATRDHGLEGVVAKRLGSPYLPGARSGAWVKHKHRRTESFVVTGWSPAERRRPESLLLARVGSDGSLEPAGTTPLVLAAGQADEVRRKLEPLVLPPTRRGQRIRRLAPALRAVVAFHGPPRGPVRDPILRAVAALEPRTKASAAPPRFSLGDRTESRTRPADWRDTEGDVERQCAADSSLLVMLRGGPAEARQRD
jgi:ATP-dependent DNA ligase